MSPVHRVVEVLRPQLAGSVVSVEAHGTGIEGDHQGDLILITVEHHRWLNENDEDIQLLFELVWAVARRLGYDAYFVRIIVDTIHVRLFDKN